MCGRCMAASSSSSTATSNEAPSDAEADPPEGPRIVPLVLDNHTYYKVEGVQRTADDYE